MFHAHVYFDPDQAIVAERFRQQIARERRDVIALFGLVPRRVGRMLSLCLKCIFAITNTAYWNG